MHHSKAVLITGCSSGIGYCLAKGLHHSGYRVIASCRSMRDVDALGEQHLDALQLDLNSTDSIAAAVEETLKRTNHRLYALINNGAYGQPGAVEDLTAKALRDQFETNVFGTQALTNLVLPVMRRQHQGRIIQISSVLGRVCLKFRGAYNASKYALEALTDTMRLELAHTGIQFSLIEPGPIESDFRINAYGKYRENIDYRNSVFRDSYRKVESRLTQQEPAKYTLPPSAVLDAVLHALESDNPKIRYPVTLPARVLGRLKRILPDRIMDKLLLAGGDQD